MRKVLLRIMFDQQWQLQSVGNELHMGYAWIVAMMVFVIAVALAVLWRTTKDRGQVTAALCTWGLLPTGLLILAVTKLPIVASGLPLFGYGLMLAVGFGTATYFAGRRAATVDVNPDVIWDMTMWLLVPAIIGARITYLLQYGHRVFANANGLGAIIKAAISLWDGGIVFYGGIIGGVVGLWIYCRRNEIRPLLMADIIMPSLFIGLGFGRIGCFLYGCCFGAACAMPWAVHFPDDSMTFESLSARSAATGAKLIEADGVPIATKELANVAPDSMLTTIALHPTQIYSSVLAFLLAALLIWFFRRRPFEGAVMALGWILYPIMRFSLEIIRDDEGGRLGTGLTFSQLMSIGLFISGCAAMWWLQRRHAANTGSE
jgi:phosphatidylglycerol:prolipoprotein diacylglycerol transferase